MNDHLVVNEIFFSIQGESTFAGRPCAFLRLSYCNLRCNYCDTEYAFQEGRNLTIDEILEQLNAFPTNLVEITGGEPLLQPPVHGLITRLLDLGKKVLIETGGSLDISGVDERAVLIYDIKCPDSKMAAQNLWSNLSHLRDHDQVKFVLSSRRDYEWARETMSRLELSRQHTILFSPVWDTLNPRELADWILEDGLPVHLQLQLHKILWGPDRRGV